MSIREVVSKVNYAFFVLRKCLMNEENRFAPRLSAEQNMFEVRQMKVYASIGTLGYLGIHC